MTDMIMPAFFTSSIVDVSSVGFVIVSWSVIRTISRVSMGRRELSKFVFALPRASAKEVKSSTNKRVGGTKVKLK